jgi:chorismate mutase/prephenate dehydratase
MECLQYALYRADFEIRTMSESDINKIRDRIDELDETIQELINERAECAKEIARLKKAQDSDATFYRPEREAEILRTIQERNKGPLSNEEIARLFREIMSSCLALEQPLKIAYLGPEGTFTQSAVLKHFGHSVSTVTMNSVEEVFREVEAMSVNYGVVPVENSTEGIVSHTLDSFVTSPLKICGEVELRIHHHLMAKSRDQDTINRIYSHQQSLAQCREWLDSHMPNAERIAVSSNAEAARLASNDEQAAAIAGETAADLYELNILFSNIEDEPDNTTRFLVIGHQVVPPSGEDKTSLVVSAHNKPGALYQLLKPFADSDISLTRIESRPSRKGMWDYVYFIDLEGHIHDDRVTQALAKLESQSTMLKVLGSYPRAVL